ncbi:hypothetical protein PILCRDRAFT_186358 [Piloderma croceum F 1598]|uniref:Uncharacterized protein n=1 Tax=Piloderma croceum (strain F 1598) TaxID=765440 RepID=A0A0C3BVF1_PILCF|nr:hypothetical protein PILCRDRAFT_186358 [Piloderma croceum F 1598]
MSSHVFTSFYGLLRPSCFPDGPPARPPARLHLGTLGIGKFIYCFLIDTLGVGDFEINGWNAWIYPMNRVMDADI